MRGSKKYKRHTRFKYFQIQIWSDNLKEWLWVGQFKKERWHKIMPDCIEKFCLHKNTKKGRKRAGKFYIDERMPMSQYFRMKMTEHYGDDQFWSFNIRPKPPAPTEYYKGYSQIRFITLDDNKYYLFKYNPIKLKFGIKEFLLVKINKFNKGNAKLV